MIRRNIKIEIRIDNKLKLGIITVDLSDIKNINGEQLYKGFFEKFKEMCDNELCDI